MLRESKHDYQNCLVGNYYDSNMSGTFKSWDGFVETHLGFRENDFDDTYHFVFRYDIHKQENGEYRLEVCMMLQRKGIYTHLNIRNINQETLDTDVKEWLRGRRNYLMELWKEVE